MQALFDFLEKLVTDFNWKRVWLILFIFLFTIISFFLFEQTYFSQLSKVEKVISILKDLESIQVNDKNQFIIENIYTKIAKILNNDTIFINFLNTINLSEELKQALCTSSIWILFLLIFIIKVFRRKEDIKVIYGITPFILILATIGYFLPSEGFIIYAILSNIILVVILLMFSKYRK